MEYQKIIYPRLVVSFFWTSVLHIFPLSIFLFTRHLDLVHPFEWLMKSTLQVFNVKTWLYTIPLHGLIFALGFLFSKEHSSPPVFSVSRFQSVYNLFSRNCILKATVYALLGITVPFLYLMICEECITYVSPDSLGVVYLNEENVFLIICGLWTGLYYFLRFDINSEKQLQFPVVQQVKFLELRSQLPYTIRESFKLSVVPVFYFIPLYYWIGDWVCSIFQAVMKVKLESSLTSISGLFSIPLFLNAFIMSGIYILLIRILLLVMQIHLYEHYSFSLIKQNNPNEILLSCALSQQSIPIIQYLAFYDLFVISTNKKSLRWQIFALSQPGGHPHTWNSILFESLKIMNHLIGQIEEIYDVPVVEPKPPPVPKHIHMRHITERDRQILCGPVPLSPPCKLRNLNVPQQKVLVPEPKSLADELWNKLYLVYGEVCNHPLIKFFFAPKPDARIRFLISNSQPIVWATQSISELAAKALTEDQFGIVLKDLPVIINTLLQLKTSLDKTGNFQKKFQKRDFDFCMKAALKSAVKRSLYKIAIAYSYYLTELPLPPENLQSMQNFVSFREC